MLFFLDGLTLIISHSEQITTPGHLGRRRTDVRADLRRRHLLGADLGGRDRDHPAGWCCRSPVRGSTRWRSAGTVSARPRRASTRGWCWSATSCCARVTAGFAGILEAVRTTSDHPGPVGLEHSSCCTPIAAVIIGGTLMTGGEGTVVGALIGALFIGVLQDGLMIKSVSANYLDLYLGIAVIIAMIDQRARRAAYGWGRAVPEPAFAGERIVGPSLGRRRRAAGRAHRQALRTDDRAARHQPAPAQGRGARAARRQRRRQVDADQDPLRLPEARRPERCGCKGEDFAPKSVDDARYPRDRHRLPGPGADRPADRLPEPVPAPRGGARPIPFVNNGR